MTRKQIKYQLYVISQLQKYLAGSSQFHYPTILKEMDVEAEKIYKTLSRWQKRLLKKIPAGSVKRLIAEVEAIGRED